MEKEFKGKKSNGSKSNHNFKKGSSRGKSKRSNPRVRDDEPISNPKADINNPGYYYGDNTVLDQVMNFSFNQFGGVPIKFPLNSESRTGVSYNTMIEAIFVNPSIPETEYNGVDGVDTIGLRNFIALSGSNAKTTNYAPQDVLILELAIAEVIKMITWSTRAMGLAYLFNYRNRTYPEVLLKAMGINVDDYNINLAAYRVRLNRIIAIASKIPFPATIPAFAKASEVFASIYLDDDNSALAQTYFFTPKTTWQFNEVYDDNGAGLETVEWNDGTMHNFSWYLDKLEHMIELLLTSTSLNYIYSDIMRLVQNNKITSLISFQTVPEGFIVIPTYNEEVRDWIHNMIIMGDPLTNEGQYDPGDVHTNYNDVACLAGDNSLHYFPQWYLGDKPYYPESLLLDFDTDNVSVEQRVRATRLSARYTIDHNADSSKFYTRDFAVLDMYVTNVSYYETADGTPSVTLTSSFTNVNVAPTVLAKRSSVLSKFDWSNLYYYIESPDDAHSVIDIIGDLDYYTLLDYKTLKNMYDYEVIAFYQIG